MPAVTICSDFAAPQNKVCHCFHCFPINLLWSDETGCHDLSFLNIEFYANFSLSSFAFIKRLLSSSLCTKSVLSSVYLRLLIFLLAILIPDVSQYVYLFTIHGLLDCFYFLTIMNNIQVQIFIYRYMFSDLGYIPMSMFVGLCGKCNFTRNYSTVFQNSCTFLSPLQ